jgi:ElaB/YqjD/DUF883 family membrane-anchored ribosome-binding protein
MLKTLVQKEVVLRECPNQISPSQSSKLHQCALIWSDKCAYCEKTYDELKKKLSSSTEQNKETLNELREQIEESLAALQGAFVGYLNSIT